MDDGSPRIEIELTSHDPDRRQPFRRGRRTAAAPRAGGGTVVDRDALGAPTSGAPDAEGADPPGDGDGPPASDRRRLVLISAVAGATALLVGWMLGRASSGEPATARVDASVTTTEARDATTTPSLLPGVTIAPVPPTTAPRRVSTTTDAVLEVELGVLEIDPRLRGELITVVGWTAGRLTEVDLADGTSVTRRLAGVGANIDPSMVRVGSDWVLVPSSDGSSFRVIHDDGTVERADVGDPWSAIWIPGTDRFWRVDTSAQGFGEPLEFEEVAIDGTPTGRRLELPFNTWAWLADPAGGVITNVSGGVYSVGPDGGRLVGRGDLLAIGVEHALLRTCDDEMVCGVSVVDRATGETRPLPGASRPGMMFESVYNWSSARPLTISPDERFASVLAFDPDQRLVLLDLDSGEASELAQSHQPTVVWSSDGRFAFYLDQDELFAFEHATGESFPVFTAPMFTAGSPRWAAFGLRPGPPGPTAGSSPATSAATEEAVEG